MELGGVARVLLRAVVVVVAAATAAAVAAVIPDDWAEGVARHDVLVSPSDSDPLPPSLQPVLSNGLLGWRVDAPHVFLAGVYSGEGCLTPSHRARIPATLALAVEGPSDAEDTYLGAAWDVRGAVYARRRELRLGGEDDGSIVTVEQRWYAHHAFRGLLAMELRVTCPAGFSPPGGGVALTLRDTAGDPAGDDEGQDLLWTDLSAAYAGLRVLRGKVLLPEDPSNATAPAPEVVVVSTAMPPSLRVTGSQSWHFLAALRTAPLGFGPQEPALYGDPLQGALQDHRVASLMAPSGELEALHRDRWKDIWAGAGIELEIPASPTPTQPPAASVPLPSAVNASLLALLSAGREDWPYGVAAGGLTEGGHGHVRWDTEIYILPALLLLDPARAQTMLQYRLKRRATAEAKAREAMPPMAGAMFPWESAFTGMETAPTVGEGDVDYADRAVHVSGAVAWAAWQCYLATQDRQWLATVGFPLLQGVARFWAARAQVDAGGGGAGAAHIRGVVPPDGAAGVVDDSVYTNAVAALSLRHAARAARALGSGVDVDVDEVGRWEALAAALVLPVDDASLGGAHPEYAGYAGQAVQQADAVLLGFPLGLYDYLDALRPQEAEAQRRARGRDVAYYGGRYDPLGGVAALTWGMQAVNLLDLGETQAAADALDKALGDNCYGAFAVWTERAPSEAGGIESGMTNFLPAAGGFLQALLFGYAGLRLLESNDKEEGEADARLRLFPRCPPGVEGVRLRHVAFLGSHLALNYTCSSSSSSSSSSSGGGGGGGGASLPTMTVALARSPLAGPRLALVLSGDGSRGRTRRVPLEQGSAVTVPVQEALIVGVVDDGVSVGGSPSAMGVVAVSARAREGGGAKDCKQHV